MRNGRVTQTTAGGVLADKASMQKTIGVVHFGVQAGVYGLRENGGGVRCEKAGRAQKRRCIKKIAAVRGHHNNRNTTEMYVAGNST